jgi:ferritin
MPQLSKKMNGALNDQINMELASAYIYLSMSAYCAEGNLKGAASWLRIQWGEELEHATKLIDYVGERGGSITLKAIAQPASKFDSLLDVFEQVLAHEQKVTAAIHKIYDLAVTEKDYASQGFLQWYVNEQVEEENSPAEIISMLRLAGDTGAALLMIDRQLGERARE